ncbi:MAG: DUF1217 domain-containing protein [Marinibacterium sp.]
MTYQPVVVGTGLLGWRFLQATYDQQYTTFASSAEIQRDAEYYRENILSVTTAEELVADRRLLNVALGAFGLQDDLDNRAFIQRILADGTTTDDALANRLADDRYRDMSEAFGFGPGEVRRSGLNAFAEEIITKFQEQAFEVAVGEQDETMRISLYSERVLQDLAEEDKSEAALWFNILGEPPLRAMLETAFGLPPGLGSMDLEKQVEIFRDRANALLGDDTVAQFADADRREKLITLYAAKVQVNQNAAGFSPAAAALQLLQA